MTTLRTKMETLRDHAVIIFYTNGPFWCRVYQHFIMGTGLLWTFNIRL